VLSLDILKHLLALVPVHSISMIFFYILLLFQDGFSLKYYHPLGDIAMVMQNILFIYLPALRSLDLAMDYYATRWPVTTVMVPLNYLRLVLPSTDILIRLMSTPSLSQTLRQLHVRLSYNERPPPTPNLSISMTKLHIFTLVQTFFSMFTIEWIFFEMLTSFNVMPVLRRANISIFIDNKDVNCLSSSPLFTDHRHVDVHFAVSLVNCPQYADITQYIPHGNRFHPREIVGVSFVVNHRSDPSEWHAGGDPFVSYFILYSCPYITLRCNMKEK
jgi:hypothetical protein